MNDNIQEQINIVNGYFAATNTGADAMDALKELEGELARLRQQLQDTRDELSVYRLASETAVYEASQFDRALFLSGDRGVEDVMRRVLDALKQAQQELKIAHSRAIRAEAQAATIAAERDGLRQEVAEAQMQASQNAEGYALERDARILAVQQRDTAPADAQALAQASEALAQLQTDARELAQALNRFDGITIDELPFVLDDVQGIFATHGAKYLEPKP